MVNIEALRECPLANDCSQQSARLDFDKGTWNGPARSEGISSHKEVVITLTDEQRSEIKEKLDKEVSHIKLWIVLGTVVLAEVVERPERADAV